MSELKVIGSGFGRTGTLSMKGALEELGFGPCYHMEEVFKNPSHVSQWHAQARTGEADWDKVFANYRSTVDFPGSVYWRELHAKYPEAKVLHTVRDPEKWWNSVNNTIYRVSMVAPSWFGKIVRPAGRFNAMVAAVVWDGLFGGRFSDKAHAIEVFERETEAVKAAIPPDQLLVYQVGDGWEPLCEFLGVPVPTTDFPHVNDTDSFNAKAKGLQFMVNATRAALVATPIVAAAIAWKARPSLRQ